MRCVQRCDHSPSVHLPGIPLSLSRLVVSVFFVCVFVFVALRQLASLVAAHADCASALASMRVAKEEHEALV